MDKHELSETGAPLALSDRAIRRAQSKTRKTLLDSLLSTMLEAMPDYALVLDRERRIIAANRRLLENFGIAEMEALIGQRPGEILGCLFTSEGPGGCGSGAHCGACGANRSIRESQRRSTQVSCECHITMDRQGMVALDLEVLSTPAMIGEVPITICVFKDISAERRRSVLEQVFFHDVLNTVGGIRGIASMLTQAEAMDRQKEREYIQWMMELSERLGEEINHQRKLLAAERGEFRPTLVSITVPTLMHEVRALYLNHDIAAGRNLVLGTTPDCTIVSDAAILRRILGNLVKNALEATARGETVVLCGEESADAVTFSVQNPGVMPRQVQLQLFQRSFSTKAPEGRGIGTYSVKLFAERYLKGKVAFVSQEPEGTIFSVSIPKTFHEDGQYLL